jgi:hypothetical protein
MTPPGVGFLDWQATSGAQNPDLIAQGLGVSVFAGLQLRLAAGLARVGGCVFRNTSPADITASGLIGSGSRLDRLVLRLTVSGGGSAIDIQPAIIQGASGATPALPQPTQVLGGVWETPIAWWRVTGNTITDLTAEYYGPGRGASGSFYAPSAANAVVGGGAIGVCDVNVPIVVTKPGLMLIDGLAYFRSIPNNGSTGVAVWAVFNGQAVSPIQQNGHTNPLGAATPETRWVPVAVHGSIEVLPGTYFGCQLIALASGGGSDARFDNCSYHWRQVT